ncbi:MAG: T9SS C-terminal target domain-containing protein [Cytophagales bacterium]|nr:MAG: T9SS C-terminal target domain-containing protein [Cytophagales bacterium]TAF61327.1 MAG: T9SS C-terminal target domain-containing protein [Cytophagales bacterium]
MLFRFVLVYISLVCLCGHVWAAELYVSNSGTDIGSCNIPGMPCQTINFAISRAFDGDRINVEAGTYDEAIVINKRVWLVGADSANTTLTSSIGDAIYIKSSGLDTVSQYILIKNFRITAARHSGIRMGKLGETFVACVRLENLAIHDNLNSGAIFDSGIIIDARWGGMMRDIALINSTVYRNNRTGILIYGGWRVPGVPAGTVKGHHRADNIRLINVQVLHNNVSYNQFDVYFVYFNGNAVLHNVKIESMNGTAEAGIHFYGFVDLSVPSPRTSIHDPGQIIFSNFRVRGNYRGACHFMSNYRTLANFKYNNPSIPGQECRLELIGRPDSVIRGCIVTWCYGDGTTPPGELDLNDTELVLSPDFNIPDKVRSFFIGSQADKGGINASKCKFITPTYPSGLNPDILQEAFMIEDRILHTIDGHDPSMTYFNSYGLLVKVRDSTAYVTPLSYNGSLAESANINRAIRAVGDGWKIYIQKSDTVYNSSTSSDITSYRYATPVVVNKSVELRTDGLFLSPNSQTNIHHLQMNGAGKNLFVNGNFGIKHLLHLTSGNVSVAADKELVLHSNAAQTAMVINDSSHTVTGAVRVQRHITGHPIGYAPAGYHYLASPVQSPTFAQLEPEMDVRVYPDYYWYNPAYTDAATFPNVFKYVESGDNCDNGNNTGGFEGSSDAAGQKGWRCPSSEAETMETGRGYAVYIPTNTIADLKGILHNDSLSIPLSFSGGTCPFKGWNLIGNPYPSPLDWETVLANNMGVVNAAIYRRIPLGVFNNVTWATYLAGVGGTNDATKDIALGQGFFVEANTDGFLRLDNSMRPNIYQNPLFYRQHLYRQGLVKLRLKHKEYKDECIIYFQDNATENFDGLFDARKMLNTKDAPNVLVRSGEGLPLSIGAFPTFSQERRLSLEVVLANSDPMTLEIAEVEYFDKNVQIMLFDRKTNTEHDLMNASYNFNYEALKDQSRFDVVFKTGRITGLDPIAASDFLHCFPNPAQAQCRLVAAQGLDFSAVRLRSAQGQICKQITLSQAQTSLDIDLKDLLPGFYILEVQSLAGVIVKKLVVR